MAGIGFELKKLLVGRGILRKLRAYSYASVVCAGTMLLAVLLLICLETLSSVFGADDHESEITVVLTVYALLFSLLCTSGLIMLLSRYVADMLYDQQYEYVMPSLHGGAALVMIPGGILYGVLLCLAPGIWWVDRLLDFFLFITLLLVWLQMAYITAVKDYKRVLRGFALGVCVAIVTGVLLLFLELPPVTALLFSVLAGYVTMAFAFERVLSGYFPPGKGSLFRFVGWAGKYPQLPLAGFFSMFGAFVHLMLMWHSPLGQQVEGVFFHAPAHDVAAFYAYLVTLPTTINFVMSVEVNFYPYYRKYFAAIIGGGTLGDISLARGEMNTVLNQEIFQMSQVQVFALIVYISLFPAYLSTIGFSKQMISMFRMMCVGYSAYAIGNCVMLLQLYFDDRWGALLTTGAFALTNTAVTLLTRHGADTLFGVGLLAAGCVCYIVGILRLRLYVYQIDYHVFCGQPVLSARKMNRLERLGERLNERALARVRVQYEKKETAP